MLPTIPVYKKSRLIVQKGIENIALKVEDIAFVYTENKMFYVIDSSGKKYLCNQNLSELEEQLDERLFFRANRQHIININYIRGFKSVKRVKLQVELRLLASTHSVIVSQETAPLFKKWIYEA